MVDIKEIKKWLENYDKAVEAANEKIAAYATSELKKTNAKIQKQFGAYQKELIRDLFKESVTEFYNAYTPSLYDREGNVGSREGGLYDLLDDDMFRIVGMDNGGIIEYNSQNGVYDLVTPVLLGREGVNIFNTVFKEGYHGGAKGNPDSNGYCYRFPDPYYTNWGDEAYPSDPPADIFEHKWISAEDGEMAVKFKELKDSEYADFADRVSDKYQSLIENAMTGGI